MAEPLQDMFDRFAVEVAPTFRPAAVASLPIRTRRQVLPWAALLAGGLALLVGGSATALTMTGGTSTPTPGQADRISENRLGIPGWEFLERPQLGFASGVIWAYAKGPCGEQGCVTSELASSTDSGRTWNTRPAVTGELFVSSRGTVYLREPGVATWEMTDTGSSWQRDEIPGPRQLLLENGGDLVLECPGTETYGGPSSQDCADPQLVSLTRVDPPVVPAGMGRLTQVVKDGVGRTWLLGRDLESRKYRLASSPDDGRTWAPVTEHETTHSGDGRPDPADAERIRITASPVDGDVYVVAAGPLLISKVTLGPEDRAVVGPGSAPFASAHPGDVRALGGGGLAGVSTEHDVWIFNQIGGSLQYGPEVSADSVDVLADGTAVFHTPGGGYRLSAGQGTDRGLDRIEP